jgi:hypothetical protein
MLIEAIDHVQQHEHSDAMAAVRGKLSIFAMKVNAGIARASYSTSNAPRVSLADSMGIATPASNTANNAFSKKAAYEKWYLNPTDCTAEELELSITYRIEQGLVSEEEANDLMMAVFDTKMNVPTSTSS